MPDRVLGSLCILVVEDEYFLARDLVRDLTDAGATAIGPVPTVVEALQLLDAVPPLDAAILDINLSGEMVYPVADVLADRGVPFVFVTGYDPIAVAPRYAGHARCEKPVDRLTLIAALGRAMAETP